MVPIHNVREITTYDEAELLKSVRSAQFILVFHENSGQLQGAVPGQPVLDIFAGPGNSIATSSLNASATNGVVANARVAPSKPDEVLVLTYPNDQAGICINKPNWVWF